VLAIVGLAWRHHSVAAQPSVKDSAGKDTPLAAKAGASVRGRPGKPRVYTYSIERELDHSPEAFTQGLEFDRSCQRNDVGKEECTDILWESTGAVTQLGPAG
jgi:hypothetical protein